MFILYIGYYILLNDTIDKKNCKTIKSMASVCLAKYYCFILSYYNRTQSWNTYYYLCYFYNSELMHDIQKMNILKSTTAAWL